MSLDDFLKGKKSLNGFKERIDPDIIGLDFDIMKQDHTNGVQIADPCMIDQMSNNFAWMRGHQNCWTGFPNDGKTQFTLFMMAVKALKSGWKWVIWSPEMKGANFVDGKVKVHYNVLAYDIMATITGKTPYKHINEKYHIPLMTIDEMQEQKEWIEKHFIFLDPKKRKVEDIEVVLKRVYEREGYDGILIDPFKNIEADSSRREDQHLNNVFSRFKDYAIEINASMNWIAHPKSGVSRIVNRKGVDILVPCNQYMLAGGAAWDNGMDGIYSIQRPNTLIDITDNAVTFHNLKQRMQELTCERGIVENITFDIKTRRYLFDGFCPLGMSKIESKLETLPTTGKELTNFELYNELDKAEEQDIPF